MVSDAGKGANEVKKGATSRLRRPQRGGWVYSECGGRPMKGPSRVNSREDT